MKEDKEVIHVAGVILINENCEVVMQLRDSKPGIFYPGHLTYIGGGVEEGDAGYEAAARRELQEETGYVADILHPLAEEDYVVEKDGKTRRRHVFYAIYDGKQEIRNQENHGEVSFFKLEELESAKTIPGQERLMKLAVQKAMENNLIPKNVK